MLTDASPLVNDAGGSRGLWLSVTELSAVRGISKPAVTQALKRWASAGVTVSTRKQGKALLVNVAEFDRARGEIADPSRAQAELTKKDPDVSTDIVYSRERARREAYDADLAQIRRDEQLGRLVPVDELERAAVMCGEAAVRAVDQIVNRAEMLADAVAKSGVPGARASLKEIARELRARLADEFARLPTAAMTDVPAGADEKN